MASAEQIANYLENCLANESLAHAYVFLGPKGSGRKKLLDSFLSRLVSPDPHTTPAPLLIEEGIHGHPDIKIVEPEKDTVTIEQIRELRQWLHLSPLASDKKAAVITQAERMNTEAQNAFLKVLEEPTARTYIFLLAGHVRQLLPTIISRTVPIYFSMRNFTESESVKLLQPFLKTKDPSERLRLWMTTGPDKEEVKDWLAKIIPELRQLLLQNPSVKLAKMTRSLLESLNGPTGQNWNLIAENLVITL